MKIEYPLPDAHTSSADDILRRLQADAVEGLNSTEAHERAKQFGPNVYRTQKQKSIWLMMLLQFKSPIVYLLIVAAGVTFYFRDYIEAYAILIVIVLNGIIGFLMELQARNSMNALKELDVTFSRVIRDGRVREIPSEQLVPGDLISLEAGDVVPGDAHLIESNGLQCDESSLTGESLPVEKQPGTYAPETIPADRLNMVFKGTSVTNGNGKAVITGIGRDTQLGTITSLVESSEEKETPLDRKIRLLGRNLIWITLAMTVLYAVSGMLKGETWLLIMETSIALAVAAFPEGLPIVSTVALAHGMLLMARRNAIVKKLSAVETLGSTNVILTDKTGTLTENKIHVDTLAFSGELIKVEMKKEGGLRFETAGSGISEEALQKLTLIGALCNNASYSNDGDSMNLAGDPIEIALMQFANASGPRAEELRKTYERKEEIPFSSDTKIMGTLHKGPEGEFVAAKGSVEHLLERCSRIQSGDTITELNDAGRDKILAEAERIAADGLRVLGFAYKQEADGNDDFLNSLVYVAMVGFIDPPRLDVKDAVRSCRRAGIRIVMVTGDHPLTALHIARQVELVDGEEQKPITGNEIPAPESMNDDWHEKILSSSVFARTTPRQKLDIVTAFQKDSSIVAMTGDGVNDAPALRKADIGIAMGLRGTQVAKETASIVLKDDSFVSIAEAVAHGREIFRNIRRFVIYLVSCNLGEILIVTILGFLTPAATLLPLQILFLNMVTDVFPALALALGKGDKSVMDRPPRDPAAPIVSKKNWLTIFAYAVTMTMAVLVAVMLSFRIVSDDPRIANNAAFLALSFAQLFHVFNMSSARSNLFVNEVTRNKFVWWALVICALVMALAYAVPQVRSALGLHVLPGMVWTISILAGLIPLVVVQGYRALRKKR